MNFLHSYLTDCDLSNPEYKGYLLKRSKYLMTWRKRYFVLKGKNLYFMENAETPPHGVIDLSQCLTCKSAEDVVNKKYCFEVTTPHEAFFMCAESSREKDEWIGRIGKAIVSNSSSYQTDNFMD